MVEKKESLIMIPPGGPATEFPAARPAASSAVLCGDYNLLLIPESIWMRPCRIWSVWSLRPLRPARVW